MANSSRSDAPLRSAGLTPQMELRNRRVESYRALVRPVASHYAQRCRESVDDLLQVGLLGLIRAAELYDGSQQTPFEAFARPHIRGAILHYLRDVSPTVRLPRRHVERQDRLRSFQRQSLAQLGRLATEEEQRQHLGLSQEQWERQQEHQRTGSPVAMLPEQLEDVPARLPDQEDECRHEAGEITGLLQGLAPRERQVVCRVVLAGWSYRRLAAEMNLSPSTVQRLLRRGLAQLRAGIASLRTGDLRTPAASVARGC